MRNGNSAVAFIFPSAVNSSYPTYEEWKHTLQTCYFLFIDKSSYPTYEEWKLTSANFEIIVKALRSYPTYEEWKPNGSIYLYLPNFGSYPTYEEWKHLFRNNCT